MTKPVNDTQAANQQYELHQALDRGERVPMWRTYSLNPDYEYTDAIQHGVGKYSVNKQTGEVCDCKMQWYLEGKVLLCPICWLDGT